MRIGQAIRALAVPCLLLATPAGLWGAEGDQAEATEKPAAPFESAEILRYMPDNCHMFGWTDVAKLQDSGSWLALFPGESFVDSQKTDRIVFGSTGGPSLIGGGVQVCSDDYVAVLTLKQPLSASEVVGVLAGQTSGSWHDEVVAGVTMHVQTAEKPVALFSPGGQTVVCGTPQVLRDVLKRSAPVQLPEPLIQACRRMDQCQTIGLAIAPLDILETPEAVRFLPEEMRKGMDAILFEAKADAGLRIRLSIVCAEDAIAHQLHGIVGLCLRAGQAMGPQAVQPPEMAGVLTSLQSAVHDQCLIVQGSVPPSLLKAANPFSKAPDGTPVAVNPCNPAAGASAPSYAPGSTTRPYYAATSISSAPAVVANVVPNSAPYRPANPPSVPAQASPYDAPTYPVTPYPPNPSGGAVFAGPYTPTGNPTPYAPAPSGQAPQVSTKQEIEILTGRCAELQRRLEQVEQDRDLLAERVALYHKQLEAYRQQLETQPKQFPYTFTPSFPR